jgi:ferrochelatase
LIAALEAELAEHGPQLPIYWGNRNWHPMLTDTIQQMADDGIKRALLFFTSAYSSYSGCRQYRENVAAAQAAVGPNAPEFDKLRVFYNHPGFIEPNIDLVQRALEAIPEDRREAAHIAFTAHSIPEAMAQNCRYETQLKETARLVAEGLGWQNWTLVYQSRSGAPTQPWLEPDILDYLSALKAQGVRDVVISPIGFLSDHMEVIYDLDTEAVELAAEIGLNLVRAGTVGVHPTFVCMIRDLIKERMTENPERPALGNHGPSHDLCPANCCLSGRPLRPGQQPLPAAAQAS